MPEFRVTVDSEVADAFHTEVDLLGFGDPDEYLSWIVDNRASIEQGTESAELLESYHERLVALEERLAAEGVDPATVDADADPVSEARPSEPATQSTTAARGSSGQPASTDDATTASDATAGGGPNVDRIETSTDRSPAVQTGGTADSGGDPERTQATATDASEPRAASDGGVSARADPDSEITSMHLRPERVQRVQEDPVSQDADSLKTVETDRIDEFSRRAVAETRQQLDREVETGLDYDSATTIDDTDVRPGEDLANLDALDVPGRTQGLVEARRVVVGRALAYLHDVDRARKQDFVDELYSDWPAGYESSAGWWRCVKGALKQVPAVDGGQVWRYEA